MSSPSEFKPLQKESDTGETAQGNPGNPQTNNDSHTRLPPDSLEDPPIIQPLTAGEHRIYQYLGAHGWSESKCSFYVSNIRSIQQVLVQHFRAAGWSESKLKTFNEFCDSLLPEQLSTLPGNLPEDAATDYAWQVKLVEEMNRRKRIGEKLDLSDSKTETQDDEDTQA